MASKKMWMVRAGRGAQAADEFRTNQLVAIGWDAAGDDWTFWFCVFSGLSCAILA